MTKTSEAEGKCIMCNSEMNQNESKLKHKLIHFGCWQSNKYDQIFSKFGGRKLFLKADESK